MTDRRFLLLSLLAATVLAGLFWWPLLSGGGFVGGNIYSYYFPQKMAYADVLQQGQWPFWNDRTGHGYPVLGESQTGVFYPLHLAIYTWLDVNTAYNASHLVHYVLAFVFTAGYARRFGMALPGALLAALVYVYGWFPCRSCWEWAIIGGTWLPAALWSVECLLQTRRWRFAGLLALILAVQLLAGHFQLAWITQLVLVVYVPCRLWLVPVASISEEPLPTGRSRFRSGLVLLGAGVLGLGLAAMQLLPTWEFREVSQRAEVGTHHDLQFGSIPAWYWSQAVMPFKWYSPWMDRTKALQEDPPVQGAQTNAGEAHLYFGLAPLVLAVLGIAGAFRDGDRRRIFWAIAGTAALFYTTGRLVPLFESLPGFSFFQGPGRYGIVVTLAVALLAGEAAGRLLVPGVLVPSMALVAGAATLAALGSGWWLVEVTWGLLEGSSVATPPPWLPSRMSATVVLLVGLAAVIGGVFCSGAEATVFRRCRWLVLATLAGATICDLWLISRLVQFTEILDDPPIVHLSESEIARRLADSPGPTRVFAPMANFPTVLGTSSTPVYFTFGPSEYTRSGLMMPQSQVDDPKDSFLPQSARQMRWLERAGVTHILSFRPIDTGTWPVEEVWRGRDRVMNQVLRHFEPLYLYRLTAGRGRAAWEPAADGNTIDRLDGGPGEKTIDVTTRVGGRLVLTELMAPGWRVEVDGRIREAERDGGLYRAVTLRPGDSRVRWYYQPPGLYWGLLISGLSLLLMAGLGCLRLWFPGWLAYLDMDDPS